MSVSILAVDDEADVADLFRQHFRREVRQGQYVLHFRVLGRGSAAEARPGYPTAANRHPIRDQHARHERRSLLW
jgi:hypothetical protein